MYYIPVYIHIRHRGTQNFLVDKSEDEQHILEHMTPLLQKENVSHKYRPLFQLQAWKDCLPIDFNGKNHLNISQKITHSHFSKGSGPEILEQMNPPTAEDVIIMFIFTFAHETS